MKNLISLIMLVAVGASSIAVSESVSFAAPRGASARHVVARGREGARSHHIGHKKTVKKTAHKMGKAGQMPTGGKLIPANAAGKKHRKGHKPRKVTHRKHRKSSGRHLTPAPSQAS